MSETKAKKDFVAALEVAAVKAAVKAVGTGSLKTLAELKYEYNVVCCQHPECIEHFEMFSLEEAEELEAKGYDFDGLEEDYIHAEEESKRIEQFKGFDNPSEPVESVPPVPEEEPVEFKCTKADSWSQSPAENFKLLDGILADITPLALPVITVLIANLTRGATYEDALASALACDNIVRNDSETN